VAILQKCQHKHLLPLLGYCLRKEAPCLAFPLMRGGSLQCRLQPTDEDREYLRRLGRFTTEPKPLTWRQRLRIVAQATEALVYLHGRSVTHRDFKPANILLDDSLTAFLSDTGFAKAAQEQGGAAGGATTTRSGGMAWTPGFADPAILKSGFSPSTDGCAAPSHRHPSARLTSMSLARRYAVGMTLLVCLTNRPPIVDQAKGKQVDLMDALEEEHDEDFEEIAGERIAERDRRMAGARGA